jgi:large subunit ribosomal protein L14
MITVQTKVVISDNTGGLIAQCIKILGHSNRKVAKIGDVIVVSIKTALLGIKGGKKREAQLNKTGNATSQQSGKNAKIGSKQTNVINIRKGEVHKALVIRTKVPSGARQSRISPHGLHGLLFEDNAIVILNNKYEPLGTRIFGPINSFELRKKPIAGTLKILSLAQLSL